jgi:tetratricopeptide (TPR) repeat protein
MLGVVQFRLQSYPGSASSLKTALKLNGSHADSYYWLGKIHLLQGEKKEALECFERAVKLEPKHLGAYYQLGLLYARNGEKEKSKEAMEMQRQLNAQMHKGLVALRMP